jgi:hypothetical protein
VTVADLIARLQEMPQDARILVPLAPPGTGLMEAEDAALHADLLDRPVVTVT